MRLMPVLVLTALPFTLVKSPPIKILPFACTAMLATVLFAPPRPVPPLLLKALSSVPSALRRAMRLMPVLALTALPFTLVKVPPIRILPSACTTTLQMKSLAPPRLTPPLELKSLSRLPSAFSRAM